MARKLEPGRMVKTKTPGIYKRNGVYVVRVWNPRRQPSPGYDNYTAGSWDDAQRLKRDGEAAKQLRKRVGPDRLTVVQWADRWLKLFPRRKDSTNLHNAERVQGYVREFGDQLLPGCSPLDAREWAIGNRTRVPSVRAMLNDAMKVHVCDTNPFNGLRLERSKGRQQIRALSEPELARLVNIARVTHGEFGETVFAPMIEFAAWTGLRPGELFALERADVDFRAGEVHVERQWHSRLGRVETVKNELRRAVVLLPAAERALRAVTTDPRGGPIFRTVNGSGFSSRSLHYYFDPVRAAFLASLPADHWLPRRGDNLDFYELRHVFGTMLAHKGATPYEIADQMGHQDGGKIAMQVYIHQDSETARESIRARFREAS